MLTTSKSLLQFGSALVFLFLVTIAAPSDAAAQCSGCKFTGSELECGDPSESYRCEGGSHGWCAPCGWAYAAVPADLSPAGTLFAPPAATKDWSELGMELSPGVSVLRSACSGAITDRFYTEEAAARARAVTATLVFE